VAKPILVAEDDRALSAAVRRALEKAGYTVAEVHDGAAALQFVQREAPVLIVLDLLLPKQDGRSLLRNMARSETLRGVPVIAVSGVFRGRSTERELQDLGAQAFLEKPFSTSDLIAHVHTLIGLPAQTVENQDGRVSLAEVPPVEFLWKAAKRNFTGALQFQSQKLHKVVLMLEGELVSIRSNAASECLGRRLLRQGRIDRAAHDESVRRAKEDDIRQGEALVEIGAITAHEVEAELVAQTRDKLLDLCGWSEGEAWLHPGVSKLSYATSLESWTPRLTVLAGAQRMRFERVMSLLTPLAEKRIVAGELDLGDEERNLPTVASYLRVAKPGLQLGPLLADHAHALYGLWTAGVLHFADAPPVTATPAGSRQAEVLGLVARFRTASAFEILEVHPNVQDAGIQAAFMKLAKRYHPDRFAAETADTKAGAAELFALISAARDALADADKRKEYLAKQRSGPVSEEDRNKVRQILDAEKLFQQGEDALKLRDFAGALASFGRAVELDPSEGDFHTLHGWTYYLVNKNQPDAAQVALEKIEKGIALAPESTKGYYYCAQLHMACGREEAARKLYKKVQQLDPKHVEAERALRLLTMRSTKEKPPGKSGLGGLFGFGRKKD
jgi:CheY-like chemotaxis protein/Flp pilus assembly protein TadD